LLADGSKLNAEYSGTTMAEPTASGSVRGSYHGIARFTGGTGKLSRIRGTIAEVNDFDNDPKTGYNRSESKGEYWFED
jgi:Tfp pilus assembly protein PilO